MQVIKSGIKRGLGIWRREMTAATAAVSPFCEGEGDFMAYVVNDVIAIKYK